MRASRSLKIKRISPFPKLIIKKTKWLYRFRKSFDFAVFILFCVSPLVQCNCHGNAKNFQRAHIETETQNQSIEPPRIHWVHPPVSHPIRNGEIQDGQDQNN